MTKGVEITKDKMAALVKSIQQMVTESVLVGIPAENADREPDAEDPHPDINNAQIGYINEFGAPDLNIPARPHLVPGIEDYLPKAITRMRVGAVAALDGKKDAITKTLTIVGLEAVSSVQNYMTTADFVPLADYTIKRRQAKGHMGTRPLIETGQYRRAMNFVIRKSK